MLESDASPEDHDAAWQSYDDSYQTIRRYNNQLLWWAQQLDWQQDTSFRNIGMSQKKRLGLVVSMQQNLPLPLIWLSMPLISKMIKAM